MNQFSDQGVILSVRPHGESGAVIHLLTENHGKCGGYVNGAQSSSRLRSLLQPGNVVSCDWQSKSDGALGRFDVELEKDFISVIFDNHSAIQAVQSVCALIDMFLADHEEHSSLFNGTVAFLNIIKTPEWPAVYILWELAFLKEMGYGIDLSKCAVTGVNENLTHVSPKTGRAVCAKEAEPYKSKLLAIPNFMRGEPLADKDIELGLKLTGYFLIHRLLQHSSFNNLPAQRQQLEKHFENH